MIKLDDHVSLRLGAQPMVRRNLKRLEIGKRTLVESSLVRAFHPGLRVISKSSYYYVAIIRYYCSAIIGNNSV